MNYLRGAVNAISAPYQYYRDLPPINPSTLTGAIDVIVIRRAKDNGDYEFACSPFHVRFGKLQVLRPGEKQVNVSVNGKAIPFSMKIGDAGEAFFVFETDEDIPEDLVTSPILSATSNENVEIETGRFGAKQSPDGSPDTTERADDSMQEPDFLDLDAPKTSSPTGSPQPVSSNDGDPAGTLPHIPFPGANDPSAHADAASEPSPPEIEPPDVMYTDGVALDMAGYHSQPPHARDLSDETVTSESVSTAASSSSHRVSVPFPSKVETSHLPSIVRRAVSESPDEPSPISHHDLLESNRTPMQEYSWEWGGFPTPSATKTHFMQLPPIKPGRTDAKGKSKALPEDDGVDNEHDEATHFLTRSRSVPPELEGSPHTIRAQLPPVDTDDVPDLHIDDDTASSDVYGAGGQLTAQQDDPTKFQVWIENRIVNFELAVIDTADHHLFDGRDELGAARAFDENKVDYAHLVERVEIVQDERLVIRCAGGQYITRDDGSPLMDALQVWVAAAPKGYLTELPPSSPVDEPLSEPESDSWKRATSEPPEMNGKPTSSSWTRWWSRSRTTDVVPEPVRPEPVRPELRNANTVDGALPAKRLSSGSAAGSIAASHGSSSAPPSTPSAQHRSATMSMFEDSVSRKAAMEAAAATARVQEKRFAKTLRLSSDQLKSLELKQGANSITFSLSASAAPACTARIFVWDSTDQVVVSDIDGTITKSDGLGHFFTMIGRDWTHLGVAKLYTDITKNGYKIMYLTSRAIGQADSTRDYLKGVKQNDYQLPEGPVIMSPDRLMASLHREVIMRKPEVFKMACLRDIQRLFGEMSRTPFYAGFGNRITDALSYRSVNVPSSRIFTIDSTGEVKMELLELAGYKSSYIHMTDLVDQMFPPIHRKWAAEFTDFNYWKPAIQDFPLPDLVLAPPSPALSARSDTSNQSTLARLRNFSLVGTRSANNVRLPSPAASDATAAARHPRYKSIHDGDGSQESEVARTAAQHLRQMSSFERLSSRLAGALSTSSSSTAAGAGSGSNAPSPSSLASLRSNSSGSRSSHTFLDSDDEADIDLRKERHRRTSMTSMPGSLDDEMQFDMEDEEDAEREGYEGEEEGEGAEVDEVAAEEAFDEDFFATGEMKNVPFL
ncbi:LNS2-domain-containing protein [Coniophora puteana RWD-64-598 SS2]|uniref:phosphatidate phosphatase n=1 Tax=Coniophora puteana (strain RWD-64-598) TaxID=741705 RepID=A0A5M3MAP2_CONPW|nr:LNS2-domain-containing protein [Coniophora puteana RWD-64-598 SS2]EIW76338.1 LNS2-domain-containing protein [Coniophora puteana RWD-64-598 SS2]